MQTFIYSQHYPKSAFQEEMIEDLLQAVKEKDTKLRKVEQEHVQVQNDLIIKNMKLLQEREETFKKLNNRNAQIDEYKYNINDMTMKLEKLRHEIIFNEDKLIEENEMLKTRLRQENINYKLKLDAFQTEKDNMMHENAMQKKLIEEKDLNLNILLKQEQETNKLLLSLDPELINLVANHKSIPAPEITDKASLKIRRQNVIDALYNKEDKQCPNCGLRFSKDDKASLDAHLDEHYRIKSEHNKSRRGEHWKRRAWYPRFAVINSLTEDKSSDTNEQKKEEVKEEIPPMIPIDNILLAVNNDIIKCNLCCEEFDQIYIHDQDLLYKANSKYEKFKEGWYLKNAIWSGTEVMHPTCSN